MTEKEVLLVEANEAVRNVLAHGLRDIGYKVWEVDDVVNILDLASGGVSMDIIVSNVHVPGLPANKAFSRLREVYPAAKIIAITGSPDVDDLSIAVDRLLYKPFDADTLHGVISELLGEKRSFPEGLN